MWAAFEAAANGRLRLMFWRTAESGGLGAFLGS